MAEDKRDWDIFVQMLAYANNAQIQCTAEAMAFSLVLSRQAPGSFTFHTLTARRTNTDAETPPNALRLPPLNGIAEMRHNAYKLMKATKQRIKQHYDSH